MTDSIRQLVEHFPACSALAHTCMCSGCNSVWLDWLTCLILACQLGMCMLVVQHDYAAVYERNKA